MALSKASYRSAASPADNLSASAWRTKASKSPAFMAAFSDILAESLTFSVIWPTQKELPWQALAYHGQSSRR